MSTHDSDGVPRGTLNHMAGNLNTSEASRVIMIKALQKALAAERASKGDVLLRLSAAQDQLVEAERHLEWWAHECDKLDEELSKLRLQYQRARASAWANGIVATCLALGPIIMYLVGY